MFSNDRPDPSRTSPSTGPASQTRWGQPNTLAGMTQPAATVLVGEGYLTMSFVWMTLGLLLSAGTAAVVLNLPNFQQTVAQWYLALVILEFVFVIGVSAAINRIGALPGLALFFAFAILNGATLSIIALVYTGESIATAFVSAAAVFGAAALYGVVTRRDLTKLGGILFMGLIGLVVMSFANFFVGGSDVQLHHRRRRRGDLHRPDGLRRAAPAQRQPGVDPHPRGRVGHRGAAPVPGLRQPVHQLPAPDRQPPLDGSVDRPT